MEELIKTLTDCNAKEIISALDRITEHIKEGYITEEDKFFYNYCYPMLRCSFQRISDSIKKL